MRTLVRELLDPKAEAARINTDELCMAGWVTRIRELGAISFVLLRDRSGELQLVLDGKADFSVGSVIEVHGSMQENEKAPGGIEVAVKDITVLGPASGDPPLSYYQNLDAVSIDTVLDHRHLSLRNDRYQALVRIQSVILDAFASYLRSQDFTEIKTSKLVATGTEGGTGLFKVEYFDDSVFLAQSPQFYKQALVASGLERVFEIGDAYRAEKHDTPRHLNEYVSLDVETAFIESEHDLISLEKEILKSIFARLDHAAAKELALWNAKLPRPEAVDSAPIVDYDEAKGLVSKEGGKKVFDINPEAERILNEWALREHGSEFVFVTEFPRRKRPFYTYPKGNKTHSFDLLFRGLEITTGGRRLSRTDELIEALPKFGLTEKGMADYLEIFRFGCPPHGGFAIGLERLTQQILGIDNVKLASLYPRDRKRMRP